MEMIPLQPKLASSMTNLSMASPLPTRMEREKNFNVIGLGKHRSALQQISSPLSATDDKKKQKAVFVLGTTATGKSKLSIDLATHFQGFVEPGEEFTPQDFRNHVHKAMKHIIGNGNTPIIAGGSNRYMEALVEDPLSEFKDNYDPCFLWVDVALPILFDRAAKRVDEMLDAGLVNEVRCMFIPGMDHSSGIWRAIGIPELEPYFQAEMEMADELTKKILLDTGIKEMKENTKKLIEKQLRENQMFGE
ncbi:hypothetical protein OIU78_001079 [Salix suchowensis]|nr:hypothetical protein OIU78_001079 [Salix suchowensis]